MRYSSKPIRVSAIVEGEHPVSLTPDLTVNFFLERVAIVL